MKEICSDRYFISSVKLGPKGQIVIPKEVREMFGLENGDTILLTADRARGIVLRSGEAMQSVVQQIFSEEDTYGFKLRREQEDFLTAARKAME